MGACDDDTRDAWAFFPPHGTGARLNVKWGRGCDSSPADLGVRGFFVGKCEISAEAFKNFHPPHSTVVECAIRGERDVAHRSLFYPPEIDRVDFAIGGLGGAGTPNVLLRTPRTPSYPNVPPYSPYPTHSMRYVPRTARLTSI